MYFTLCFVHEYMRCSICNIIVNNSVCNNVGRGKTNSNGLMLSKSIFLFPLFVFAFNLNGPSYSVRVQIKILDYMIDVFNELYL